MHAVQLVGVCGALLGALVQLVGAGKKTRITGFNDPSIADSRAVIDLVDACKKGSVNYDLVKPGHLQQVRNLPTSSR